ncbi:M23 family metallopeptidase [Chelativorans sp. M5D2P16]|uniref:M23 family metallopeptidase n=1 Tax=Chelativorans sp. M5D2P16 TaxID=3095678 RepID=UPI002ACA1DDE|nr:M23 family metallopeptidase [Chelativorans sp. M5D2P16]MDZ5699868.1 M23 family metallopeptidase [Chelativorans sp. M5D2P16]
MGNEPPLIADGRSGPPDRREISARWLLGTFLTGVTSTVLMGVALSAALDGREQLATPPETALPADMARDSGEAAKTTRLVPTLALAKPSERRRMEVSTVMKQGDRDVIRTLPFVHVRMALAAGHSTNKDYPPFDPLSVFAEDGATSEAPTGLIYGAKVESEVSLRTVPFPVQTAAFDENSDLTAEEVEQVVRNTGSILTEGDVQVAALHYVDPQRFGGGSLATGAFGGLGGVRIVQENVSVAQRTPPQGHSTGFAEDIISFTGNETITEAFRKAGYEGEDAEGIAQAIGKLLNAETLKAGTLLRVGVEVKEENSRVVRTSVYDGRQHVLTVALDDRNQFVPAEEPDSGAEFLAALDNEPRPLPARTDLPRIYDGIYNAAYSYGLTKAMTQKLIRLLAADVDFQSRLSPSDRVEVFFSQPNEDGSASDNSELLYVSATFGDKTRTFYRFQMPDGTVDYFDREGRSSRPLLLRNPVPNGRFTSGFGMRRHPILGYSRMHTGVDWAAPRGTPIIASGDGTVESAGWAAGYGRQTIVRHANGYRTSYNHQSAIAKGVVAGAHVRQGQVIGYVGSTGQSTGNHLHYEVIVNDRKVDPMRVRLPDSHTLEGEALTAFKRERDRLENLLQDSFNEPVPVAEAAQ